MELLFVYLLFAAGVGIAASQRGRSGGGWFVISILISPLIAAIILALMPSLRAGSLESQVRDRLLEQQYSQYIRGYKPAFSNSVFYDVTINGATNRFRTKAEAIAFCVTQLPQHPNSLYAPPQYGGQPPR